MGVILWLVLFKGLCKIPLSVGFILGMRTSMRFNTITQVSAMQTKPHISVSHPTCVTRLFEVLRTRLEGESWQI